MKNVSRTIIARASRMIRKGKLVIFPTETVYGIGASVFHTRAVQKIFRFKGRPSDNPLIVHIAHAKDVHLVARNIPHDAEVLMKKLWPGPLTIVLKKTARVPRAVTAGLDTVAVRMPAHPVARMFIKKAGVPIAAPSANVSGRPSATEAWHAKDDFKNRALFILDAGPARYGVESTVVDVTGRRPVLLRQGAIPREVIERVLGKKVAVARYTSGKARSPGMKYRHYAPRVPLIVAAYPHKIGERLARRGFRVGMIRRTGSLAEYASILFSSMRHLEKSGVDYIVVQSVSAKGLGATIMDRMMRASSGGVFRDIIKK